MLAKKVLLGMSGGVDSSVAALKLKEQGYEVVGTTMELCSNGSCCNLQTYLEAKKTCENLGFEHFIFKLSNEFKEYVIDDFINCYKECRTPNPCIECNKYLKFGIMYEKAKELGIDYISTGHYAKVEYSEKYNRYVLKKSNNIKKDQTYVLYTIPKDILPYVLFPLGNYESKDEVRKEALAYNLSSASKPDSEDICFIPDGNYKEYLEKNSDIKAKEGNIITKNGEILGKHTGLYKYTIGQRKGLGVSYKEPLFVIGFNVAKNELIVGKEGELYKKEFKVYDINLLAVDDIVGKLDVEVKVRYSAIPLKATITKDENGEILVEARDDTKFKSITPGQSAVFYDGDIVIGGGKIR